MDLDFGLLQQINADIDGFPVRLDEDMDLLDFDNAFHGPVPGSFQDFANWLADTSGTVASTRNPESTQPNAACHDQSNTLNHSPVSQQQLAPSTADTSCPTVSEHMYQQQIAQHANNSPQQQQQQLGLGLSALAGSGHLDVMRQNSTQSQHSQPSRAGHRPPSAHNSFVSQHSCSSGAGLPDATLILQQQMQAQQQQQQQQQMHAHQAQVKQEQQQMQAQQQQAQQQQQQQQAAASAALSAAAGKAQQLLMSASSGFQTPAAASAATAGFLAQPLGLSGNYGGNFSATGFGAISPQGGGVLLSPHGAVLQPTLLIGAGSAGSAHQAAAMAAMQNPFAAAAAGMAGFSAQGMQGMGIALGLGGSASLGHMQGIALGGHQGIALHNSALHSLVGHGVLKHTAVDRQQK
jgi:hypothetical protein